MEAESLCRSDTSSHLISFESHEEFLELFLSQDVLYSSKRYTMIFETFNRYGLVYIGLNMRTVGIRSEHVSRRELSLPRVVDDLVFA